MPKTRKGTSSAEDTATADQPEQVEAPPKDTPSSSEPADEKKEDDAATKAQDRKARFKALQARAVCAPTKKSPNMSFIADQGTEIRDRAQHERNRGGDSAIGYRPRLAE